MVKISKTDEIVYRLFLFLIVSVGAFGLIAQSISGVVINQEGKEPIPFAAIIFLDGLKGAYTGIDGKFQITLSKLNYSQEVLVSALGYKKDTFLIKKKMVIALEEEPLILDEVVVSGKKKFKTKYHKIGYPNDRRGVWTHTVDKPFFQDAILVKPELIKGKRYLLEGVEIKLDWELSKRTVKNSPIRLRVYKNLDGFPGDDVLVESQYFYPQKSKSKVTFKTPIEFPLNGFFVAIEWLKGQETSSVEAKNNFLFSYYGHAIKLHRVEDGDQFDLNSEVSWWQFDPDKGEWIENPNKRENDNSEYSTSTFIPCIRILVSEFREN